MGQPPPNRSHTPNQRPLRPLWSRRLGRYVLPGLLGFLLVLGLGHDLPVGAVESLASPSIPPTLSTGQETLDQQAQRRYQAGDYAAAAALWQRAADQARTQGNTLELVRHLNNLALAQQRLGQWDTAEQTLTTSQDHLATLPATAPTTQAATAQTRHAMGSLARHRGDLRQAITAFSDAADIYSHLGNADGILRSRTNQARALESLGYHRDALALLTRLDPPLADRPPSALGVAAQTTLGSLHRQLGDLAAARPPLQQALAQAETLQDWDGAAMALLGLGRTAEADDQPQEALAFYRQAQGQAASSALQTQALLSAVGVQLAQGQALSSETLATATTALDRLPPGRTRTYGRIHLAEGLLEFTPGQYADPTAALLALAETEARTLGDTRALSYALGYQGRLRQRQGQAAAAKRLTTAALQTANDAPDISYLWNAQLGALQHTAGDIPAAIASYTAAVHTLESLRSDLARVDADVQFGFRATVEPIYRQLVALLTDGETPTPTALMQARDVVESLQVAELENFFREACLAVSQDIDQVVDSTDQPTAVIYPVVLPEANRLEVIVKLPQQDLFSHSVPIAGDDLEAEIARFRENLTLPYTINEVKQQGQEVYGWLVEPIAERLAAAQVETLVFVLDGSLRNIPMAMLFDGEQYLVEHYSVAVAPGLTLVDPKPLVSQSLAAIVAGLSEQRFEFPPLQFVRAEVDQVSTFVDSQVLLDTDFTEAELTQAIRDIPFPVVHLATHGQFSSNPDDTFVLAWDKKIPLANLNQILRNSEQSRASAIELLVLSACETAVGDNRATLGLAGVAVRAGARSTLASLWQVDDQASARLMQEFYRALRIPGITRAEALRQAQVAVLRNPRFRHPRFWAPFILVGNWL